MKHGSGGEDDPADELDAQGLADAIWAGTEKRVRPKEQRSWTLSTPVMAMVDYLGRRVLCALQVCLRRL